MSLDSPIKTYSDSIAPVTLALPGLACDTHVHIFGPAERFAYADTRSFTPVDAPKETLFDLHRRLGIERCVIVQSMVHGRDNRVVVDAIEASGGRYLGVALVALTGQIARREGLGAALADGLATVTTHHAFIENCPRNVSIRLIAVHPRT